MATIVLIWTNRSTTFCGVGLHFDSEEGKQGERRPRRSSRRLITLIFAGRNRIIVIRRELPRTKGAGRARKLAA